MAYRDELTKETLRVYERYAVEVVERFGFCPWARASRESQSAAVRVIFSVNRDDFADSLQLIAQLSTPASERDRVDVALLVYPLLDLDRLDFEDFGRRLRSADDARSNLSGEFAMAAFHPTAAADLSHPDRLVPYIRRTPDPTLQLVRKSVLSSIKGLDQGTAFVDLDALSAAGFQKLREPPQAKAVRDLIAEQNLATVLQVSSAVIDPILEDILRDREQAHAKLYDRHRERGPTRAGPSSTL